MPHLQFVIDINAPREQVWTTLWSDATYRDWTSAFLEGSYAVSDWNEGSRIQFLDPSGSGMSAIIDKMVANELMSFRHVAEIKDGQEQPPAAWSGAMETYRLAPQGDGTRLTVDLDTTDEYRDAMEQMFPRALERLKSLAENSVRPRVTK
jgi:uncharacterized protein YndB with AHSA1/START domain